jgi:hypothetical protein
VTSQKGKGKKKAEDEDGAVEGIVYRVSSGEGHVSRRLQIHSLPP